MSRFTCAPTIAAASIVFFAAKNHSGAAFSIESNSERISIQAETRRHRYRHRGRRGHGLTPINASTNSGDNNDDGEDCRHHYGESQTVEWKKSGGDSSSLETSSSSSDDHHRFNAKVFASSNCWGRRPLLMRGAFDPNLLLDGCTSESSDDDGGGGQDDDSIFSWPSWEEVVDIAADDESESRIISHVPGDHASFDLRWGPLTGKDVRTWISKPSDPPEEDSERRETLVVNDIDRFYPPLADWISDTFSFLPKWRMDDGQISLSEQGGGIGPHVDNYDVFLIQMSGTRTWRVGRGRINAKEERDRMIDGLDVRVLSDSSSDSGSEEKMEDWTVYPGDLLYLPPRLAHCGTALSGDCMTLSVGCRAPSVSDLVSKLAERLSTSIEDSAVRRYTDEDLLDDAQSNPLSGPGELTLEAKERARRLVMDSLASAVNDDDWWDEFFGRYVTEQKRVRNNYPIPLDDWVDDIGDDEDLMDEWKDATSTVQSVLAGKGVLYHAEGIVFAYSCYPSTTHNDRTSHKFFANGEMWQSFSQSKDATQDCMSRMFITVSNHRRLDREVLLGMHVTYHDPNIQLSSEAVSFLEELVSSGVLYGSEE